MLSSVSAWGIPPYHSRYSFLDFTDRTWAEFKEVARKIARFNRNFSDYLSEEYKMIGKPEQTIERSTGNPKYILHGREVSNLINDLCKMQFALLRPSPERLAFKPEENPKQAPQQSKPHVRHNRRNVSRFDDPWCHELAETITPKVFIDGDGHKYGTSNRLVRIHGVSGCDGWQGRHLNAGTCITNNHNDLKKHHISDQKRDFDNLKEGFHNWVEEGAYLPRPGILVAHSRDDISQHHDEYIRHHSR